MRRQRHTCFIVLLASILVLLVGCSKKEPQASDSSVEETIKTEDSEAVQERIPEEKVEDITFLYSLLDDGTAEVYGYRSESASRTIEIPSEIDGYEVTVISGLFRFDETVRKVIIPETVKEIGGETFYMTPSLEEVEIQGVIKFIGSNAFYSCDQLKSLYFKEGLVDMSSSAIWMCPQLAELRIPTSLDVDFSTTIFLSTFSPDLVVYTPAGSPMDVYAREFGAQVINDESADTVERDEAEDITFSYEVLDDGTARIYRYDAEDVPETMIIPSEIDGYTVTKISGLFKLEKNVKKVVIPDTVKAIGGETFYMTSSIEEIEIQGVIETVDANAFYSCDALKELHFKEGLTKMGTTAIMICPVLAKLSIPASLDTDFSTTIFLSTFSPNLTVYTPAGSPMDAYAREYGAKVVNE